MRKVKMFEYVAKQKSKTLTHPAVHSRAAVFLKKLKNFLKSHKSPVCNPNISLKSSILIINRENPVVRTMTNIQYGEFPNFSCEIHSPDVS